MNIKTEDKIRYLFQKTKISVKKLRKLSKENPKQFNNLLLEVENGSDVKISDSGITITPKPNPFISVGFDAYSEEEKSHHEAFIYKTSLNLLDYIEEFDLIGACHFIPYFYKMFLYENNIPMDVEYGVYESKDGFSVHSWNRYAGKLIDLTAFLQKYEINADAIILDEVVKKGKDSIVYHRADQLPKSYFQIINQMTLAENKMLKSGIKNAELKHCQEILHSDAMLFDALDKNYNSIMVLKDKYIPLYQEEYNHFVKHFINKIQK